MALKPRHSIDCLTVLTSMNAKTVGTPAGTTQSKQERRRLQKRLSAQRKRGKEKQNQLDLESRHEQLRTERNRLISDIQKLQANERFFSSFLGTLRQMAALSAEPPQPQPQPLQPPQPPPLTPLSSSPTRPQQPPPPPIPTHSATEGICRPEVTTTMPLMSSSSSSLPSSSASEFEARATMLPQPANLISETAAMGMEAATAQSVRFVGGEAGGGAGGDDWALDVPAEKTWTQIAPGAVQCGAIPMMLSFSAVGQQLETGLPYHYQSLASVSADDVFEDSTMNQHQTTPDPPTSSASTVIFDEMTSYGHANVTLTEGHSMHTDDDCGTGDFMDTLAGFLLSQDKASLKGESPVKTLLLEEQRGPLPASGSTGSTGSTGSPESSPEPCPAGRRDQHVVDLTPFFDFSDVSMLAAATGVSSCSAANNFT
ncbi:uncharacterized protein LOC143284107 [Babylonia areolata]|uniref:uncharacterized protein LOC143284107 n=1 Tax=Babylonia areolata TaxID=304850 RepID=UPI003FD22E33